MTKPNLVLRVVQGLLDTIDELEAGNKSLDEQMKKIRHELITLHAVWVRVVADNWECVMEKRRCPICDGRKVVPNEDIGDTSAPMNKPCEVCNGLGVIWVKGRKW